MPVGVADFSEELLHMVLAHLHRAPKQVCYLGQTCRFMHSFVSSSEDFWFESMRQQENERLRLFYRIRPDPNQAGHMIVTTTQPGLPVYRYAHLPVDLNLGCYVDFNKRPSNHRYERNFTEMPRWPPREITASEKSLLSRFYRRHVTIDSGLRCGLCGSKHKLTPVWNLGCKVCRLCLRDNLIGSQDLFFEYGVDFWKLFRANSAAFQQMFVVVSNPPNVQATRKFVFQHLRAGRFRKRQAEGREDDNVYFWKPHLERFFQISAGVELRLSQQRAAETLTGYIRGFFVRYMLACRSHPKKRQLEFFGVRQEMAPCKDAYLAMLRFSLIQQKANLSLLPQVPVKLHRRVVSVISRVAARHNLVYDWNKRKLLELLVSHESDRVYEENKFYTPNLNSRPIAEITHLLRVLVHH